MSANGKSLEYLSENIADISTLYIPSLLEKGYLSIPHVHKEYFEKDSKKERKYGNKVKNILKKLGIKFWDHNIPNNEHNTFAASPVENITDFKNILSGKKSKRTVETYAHEYGHIQNKQSLHDIAGKPGLYGDELVRKIGTITPGIFTGLSTLAALTGADADTVRNIGLVGMASSAPVILEEGLASYRGNKFLKENNIKHDSWKTWVGVPTYAIGYALTPMLPWIGKKIYDFYNK